MHKQISMKALEAELASVEVDALSEEKENAKENYKILYDEYAALNHKLPYPNVKKSDVAHDYEGINDLKFKKDRNKPFWDEMANIREYYNNDRLYVGHMRLNGDDYYIMESTNLDTKIIDRHGTQIWFVNVDSKDYASKVRYWRYPNEEKQVVFSRNIDMYNREVNSVDVIIDRNSSLFSEITDRYLRNALIKNKSKEGLQSIITSIQKKQDDIRSLPKTESFIVQGCAGSGKTMVLLHRIRRLIYNKELYNDEYIFLIPSMEFKQFIDDVASDFNISKSNIISYVEYYQIVADQQKSKNDGYSSADELIFSSDYLNAVYSRTFIQSIYREMFDLLITEVNKITSQCETLLNNTYHSWQQTVHEKLMKINNDATEKAYSIIFEETKEIQPYVSIKIDRSLENIDDFIKEVEDEYTEKEAQYRRAEDANNIKIDLDDIRIINHPSIKSLQEKINYEQEAINTSFFLTVNSHKRSLQNLVREYDEQKNIVRDEIIAEEKKRLAEQAINSQYVYDSVTLSQVSEILTAVKSAKQDLDAIITSNKYKLDHNEEYFVQEYEKESEALNDVFEQYEDIYTQVNKYVNHLEPSIDFFHRTIDLCYKLFTIFKNRFSTNNNKTLSEFKLFYKGDNQESRTINELSAYLNVLLFNKCKRKIKEKFDIKIHKLYKHYWYLNAYCRYLTKVNQVTYPYIFIDEAQDLCLSELELIYKLNIALSEEKIIQPVINIFGDIDQRISEHSIKEWSDLSYISDIYELNENFRNTDQIVDFCNRTLDMNMSKIGVSMESVSEYEEIDDILEKKDFSLESVVFIVKDNYKKSDLENSLKVLQITNYTIYTVKEVKGLEFREVYVCDKNMTRNEKYIAYTRALVKLNIIHSLPEFSERINLIVEGDDQEEDDL